MLIVCSCAMAFYIFFASPYTFFIALPCLYIFVVVFFRLLSLLLSIMTNGIRFVVCRSVSSQKVNCFVGNSVYLTLPLDSPPSFSIILLVFIRPIAPICFAIYLAVHHIALSYAI